VHSPRPLEVRLALRTALWRHRLLSASLPESLTTIFPVDLVITAASGLALRGLMRERPPTFSLGARVGPRHGRCLTRLETALG
jgi:hypothetical protein